MPELFYIFTQPNLRVYLDDDESFFCVVNDNKDDIRSVEFEQGIIESIELLDRQNGLEFLTPSPDLFRIQRKRTQTVSAPSAPCAAPLGKYSGRMQSTVLSVKGEGDRVLGNRRIGGQCEVTSMTVETRMAELSKQHAAEMASLEDDTAAKQEQILMKYKEQSDTEKAELLKERDSIEANHELTRASYRNEFNRENVEFMRNIGMRETTAMAKTLEADQSIEQCQLAQENLLKAEENAAKDVVEKHKEQSFTALNKRIEERKSSISMLEATTQHATNTSRLVHQERLEKIGQSIESDLSALVRQYEEAKKCKQEVHGEQVEAHRLISQAQGNAARRIADLATADGPCELF